MKINRIKLENVYGHESTEVDLREVDAAAVVGVNGAGKSTLFVDGPLFALFGRPAVRGSVLSDVIREGAETAIASVEFEIGGEEYLVERSYSIRTKAGASDAKLYQFRAGGSFEGSTRGEEQGEWIVFEAGSITEVDEAIEEVLGCDYTSFVLGSIVRQGESAAFTSSTPAERLAAISQILGVEHLQDCASKAREDSRDLDAKIAALEESVECETPVETRLEETDERLEELREEVEGLNVDAIVETLSLRSAWLEAAKSLEDRMREQRDKLAADEKKLASLIMDRSLVEREKGEQREALATVESKLEALEGLQERAEALEALEAKLDSLESKKAKVDEYGTDLVSKRSSLESIQREVDDLEERLEEVDQVSKSETDLEERIESLEEEKVAVVAKAEKVQRLRSERIEVDQIAEQIERAASMEFKTLTQRAEALERRPAECEMDHCGLLKSAVDAKRRLEELQNEGRKGAKERARAEELRAEIEKLESSTERPLIAGGEVATMQIEDEIRSVGRALEAKRSRAKLERAHRSAVERRETTLAAIDVTSNALALLLNAEGLDLDTLIDRAREVREEVSRERDRINVELSKAREAKQKLEESEQLQRRRVELRRTLEGKLEKIGRLSFEIKALRERTDGDDSQAEYTAAVEARKEVDRLVEDARAKANQATAKQSEIDRQIARLEQHRESLVEERDKAREAKAKLEGLRERRDVALYAADFFKTAPSLVLATAIPKLEDDANEVLEQIAPAFRVAIRRSRMTKAGDSRDEIGVKVFVGGAERDIALLSGGERFRVDIALRLALAEASSGRHSGRSLETLIIDEGWGSLDDAGIHDLKDAMQRLRQRFPKIFVVTHIAEVFDLFPDLVEVTRGGLVTIN